jgi:hypothetical protein
MSGLKNVGKDTSANMLRYLLNTPSFLHFYWIYKHFNFLGNFGKWKVTSFAKPLKEVLAIILGVPVEKFEDRDFKENYCVDFNTSKIYKCTDSNVRLLSDKNLSKLIESDSYHIIKTHTLTIRQCLQYIGTQICREFISDKIWINASLKGNNLIFSDLRFKKEFEELDYYDSFRVLIERPGCTPGNHASEKQIMELKAEREFEGYVDNNGTLKDLFYKLKNLI